MSAAGERQWSWHLVPREENSISAEGPCSLWHSSVRLIFSRPLCCLQSVVELAKESGSKGTGGWGWTLLALQQTCTSQLHLDKLRTFYSPGLSRYLLTQGDGHKGPHLPNIPVFDKTAMPCTVHQPQFCTLGRGRALWRAPARHRYSGNSDPFATPLALLKHLSKKGSSTHTL